MKGTLPRWLFCTLLAVLCRFDEGEQSAEWVRVRRDWLVQWLGLLVVRPPLCRSRSRSWSIGHDPAHPHLLRCPGV